MSSELTNAEKRTIVESRLKSLKSNEYNIQLSIREENVVAIPSQERLDTLSLELSDIQAKITIIVAELESLAE
jgi:hypothetical protein